MNSTEVEEVNIDINAKREKYVVVLLKMLNQAGKEHLNWPYKIVVAKTGCTAYR